MKSLIGRNKELRLLNDIYENKDAFVLLNGTNFVGKSKLIQNFIQDKPGLFFSASEASDELNKNFFKEQLENYFNFKNEGIPGNPTWEDLFRIYSNIEERERKVLVIDNLNHLIHNNPNFTRELNYYWTNYLKPKNVLLIGILPNGSTLANLEKEKRSLLKSADTRIALKPLSFIELLKDYPDKSFIELVCSYSMINGMPQYLPILANTHSVTEQIEYFIQFLLNTNSFYNDVPLNYIDNNVWEPINYLSVLYNLANGYNTIVQLSERTGLKAKEVTTILDNLISLGILQVEMSVHAKKFKAKNAKFSFMNDGFRFWAKYIFPNQSLIESRNYKKLLELIQNSFDNFIEEPFKQISKNIFTTSSEQNTINFNIDKLGSFWNKNVEIPIVAVDEKNKKLFVADSRALLKDYSAVNFYDFMEKINHVKEFKRYRDYEKIYGLFTTSNIENDLREIAFQNDNIIMFSGTTLYRKQ